MILKEISDQIIIDDLCNEFSNGDFIHFLTKPSSLLSGATVYVDWGSCILTSEEICHLSSEYVKMNIDQFYFYDLRPNEEIQVEIPNSTDFFIVTLLKTESPAGKILLLFEASNGKRVLYPGEFTVHDKLSPEDSQLIQSVDVLYLDNTLVSNHETITVFEAVRRIETMIINYPNHVYLMNIPMLGYEELIVLLTQKSSKEFKIHLNVARRNLFNYLGIPINHTDADTKNCLAFSDENFVTKTSRLFQEEKIIFIRLEEKPDSANSINSGVLYIDYSPHPTLYDLYAFVLHIRPESIVPIDSELPPIPQLLQDLCENDFLETELFSFNSSSESIDTVIFNPDQLLKEGQEIGNVSDSDVSCIEAVPSDVEDVEPEIEPEVEPEIELEVFNCDFSDDEAETANQSSDVFNFSVVVPEPNQPLLDLTVPSVARPRSQNTDSHKRAVKRNFPQITVLENRGVHYLE